MTFRVSKFLLSVSTASLLVLGNAAHADVFSFSGETVTANIDLEEGNDTLTVTNSTVSGNVNGGTDATDTVTFTDSSFTGTTFDLETGINNLTLNNSTFNAGGTTLTFDGSAAGDNQTFSLNNGSVFNNATLAFTVGAGSTGTINVDNSALTLGGNLAPGNGSLVINVSNSGTINLGANNITGGTSADQITISGGSITAGTVDLTTGDNVISITGDGSLIGNLTTGTGENRFTFGGSGTKVTGALTLAGTDNIVTLNALDATQPFLNSADFTAVKSLTIIGGVAFDPNGATTTLGSAGEALVFDLQSGGAFNNNLTLAATGASGTVSLSGASNLTGNLTGTNNNDTVTMTGSSTITGNVNLGTGDDNLTATSSTVNGNVNLGTGNNNTLSLTNSTITGTFNVQSAVLDTFTTSGATITGLATLNGAGAKNLTTGTTIFTAGFDIDGVGGVTLNSTGDTFNGNLDLSGTSGTNSVALTNTTVNAAITLGAGNDTLTLNNTTITGATNAGAGDTDTLNLSGSGTIASNFNQFENFNVNGTSWTLDNALTLEGGGTVNINTGTFTVAAGNTFTTTNSAFNVANGATLALVGNMNAGNAAGVIDGTLTLNGGTLSSVGLITINGTLQGNGTITGDGTDGNPITVAGTIASSAASDIITVNDDLTFNNASTIRTTVNGTAASRINVAGAGSVVNDTAGGIVVNAVVSNAIPEGQAYTILNSVTGGINSANYVVQDNSFIYGFDFTGSDGANLVITSSIENTIDSIGENKTERNVGNILIGGLQGSTNTQINQLQSLLVQQTTANGVKNVLEASSADTSTGVGAKNAGLDIARQTASLTEMRLATLRSGTGMSSGDDYSENYNAWLQGFGKSADQDRRDGLDGYDADTYGVAFGFDRKIPGEDFTIGLALAYAKTDVDSKSISNAKTDIDSYQVTLYGDYDLDNKSYINANLGYIWANNDTRRNPGGLGNLTASGEYDSSLITASMTYNRDYQYEAFTVTPSIGANYAYYDADSYTETGAGGANLNVNPDSMSLLEAELGLGVSWAYELPNNAVLEPSVDLGVRHDVIGDAFEASNSFVGGGRAFGAEGIDPAQTTYNVDTGISYHASDAWELSAKYSYETKTDYNSHAGFFRASYKF